MGLFVINLVGLLFLFSIITFLFRKKEWGVLNYKLLPVPYSIGTIFILLLIYDYLFYQFIVNTLISIYFFIIIWFFGLMDDMFGSASPKGLKGHFSIFIRENVITTGLVKAVAVLLATCVYFFLQPASFSLLYFLLFIFLPHMMNLLDTKPLRVWKASVLFLTVPFIIQGFPVDFLLFLFFIFILWFLYEMTMKAMLGDNGAMLLGSFHAFLLLQFEMHTYAILILFIALFLTIVAERLSIQEWVEKTPLLKQIDQLGRIK